MRCCMGSFLELVSRHLIIDAELKRREGNVELIERVTFFLVISLISSLAASFARNLAEVG